MKGLTHDFEVNTHINQPIHKYTPHVLSDELLLTHELRLGSQSHLIVMHEFGHIWEMLHWNISFIVVHYRADAQVQLRRRMITERVEEGMTDGCFS